MCLSSSSLLPLTLSCVSTTSPTTTSTWRAPSSRTAAATSCAPLTPTSEPKHCWLVAPSPHVSQSSLPTYVVNIFISIHTPLPTVNLEKFTLIMFPRSSCTLDCISPTALSGNHGAQETRPASRRAAAESGGERTLLGQPPRGPADGGRGLPTHAGVHLEAALQGPQPHQH